MGPPPYSWIGCILNLFDHCLCYNSNFTVYREKGELLFVKWRRSVPLRLWLSVSDRTLAVVKSVLSYIAHVCSCAGTTSSEFLSDHGFLLFE